MNRKIYSVKDIIEYMNRMFAADFVLRNVCITGELSGFRRNSTGHYYFDLLDNEGGESRTGKDKKLIHCVFYKQRMPEDHIILQHVERDGLVVNVTGNINFYAPTGSLSLVVSSAELCDAEGRAKAEYEKLRRKLDEEGLLSAPKKPLPRYPRRIGVITSGTGDVIEDIKKAAWDLNPSVKIYLYSVKVQGEGASRQMLAAFDHMDKLGFDVIIIGRGGGAKTDFDEYNDEALVRRVFAGSTPVITATGHTRNETLLGMVSSRDVITPTEASETALRYFIKDDIIRRADKMTADMRLSAENRLKLTEKDLSRMLSDIRANSPRARLDGLSGRLGVLSARLSATDPAERIDSLRSSISSYMEGLKVAAFKPYERYMIRLMQDAGRLDALSPTRKLVGGFGYIESGGNAVRGAAALKIGDKVSITFSDGTADATIEGIDIKETERNE